MCQIRSDRVFRVPRTMAREYIHFNPISGKWDLAKNYLDYYYSSAGFYETWVDDFGFFNNIFHE
ncbi:MAG: hypothetical protein ABI168_09220 [Ginsengibacter sp.]